MTSRSAIVLVVLVVAVIAFCFAGVFATMTGTYHLNLDFGNNTTENNTGFFGNVTEFNSDDDYDSSSDDSSVQTYTDTDSDTSSSDVETTEDPSQQSNQEQVQTSPGDSAPNSENLNVK